MKLQAQLRVPSHNTQTNMHIFCLQGLRKVPSDVVENTHYALSVRAFHFDRLGSLKMIPIHVPEKKLFNSSVSNL